MGSVDWRGEINSAQHHCARTAPCNDTAGQVQFALPSPIQDEVAESGHVRRCHPVPRTTGKCGGSNHHSGYHGLWLTDENPNFDGHILTAGTNSGCLEAPSPDIERLGLGAREVGAAGQSRHDSGSERLDERR